MTIANTLDPLRELRLLGMHERLNQLLEQPAFPGASFEQRLQMLVDAAISRRDSQPAARDHDGPTGRFAKK